MSYILDALRKSERERKRATVPDPLSVQGPHSSEKKPRPVRSYLVVVMVILGTLISGLWFGIWYAQKSHETQAPVNQTARGTQGQEQSQHVPGMNATTESENHTLTNDVRNNGKSVQVKPDLKENRKARENPAISGEGNFRQTMTNAPANTPSAPETGQEIPSPDKNRLYTLQELPGAVRQKLPDFSFSVFLYTEEPSSRTVRVNGVMMKEGQYVTDGLKLEEIIPDGVIFTYMNFRFRVGIP